MLHNRADALRLGEIGVDGRPVLRLDLLLQTSFTAQKDRFLTDLNFDRRAHRTELLTRDGTDLLNSNSQLIAPLLLLSAICGRLPNCNLSGTRQHTNRGNHSHVLHLITPFNK